MQIEKVNLSKEIQQKILDGFANYAREKVGFDENIELFSFGAYEKDILMGVINCKIFWGQLHIRHLFVFPDYRNLGMGTALLQHAFFYAKKKNSRFAFVETMDFQALDFYRNFGFVLEFSRSGYDHGVVFHYLKKVLI